MDMTSMTGLADGRRVALRRARTADAAAVEALLMAQGLPPAGVADWLDRFWVAEGDGAVVGVAGVELYGASALLRSVAVAPAWRGSGLGGLLTGRALEEAKAAGARDVYLLTTTADRYFPRHGFGWVARATVPEAVTASVEFQGACPASAVVMHRSLDGTPFVPTAP
jgi:amino-acid N-acetyltransferase